MLEEIMRKSVPWTTLLFAIALTHCPAQQPSISAAISSRPQEAGAYYYAAQKWEPLSHVLNSGRKPRHVYRLIVPSFVPEVVLIFRGTEAPVKIIERNPLFFIRPSATGGKFPGGLSRDVLLVRLEKKRDHRELPVTS